jgi:hypothetical protein
MPTNYRGEYRPHPPKISAGKRLAVYVRDEWTCQYCGRVFVPEERNLTGKYAPYDRKPGDLDVLNQHGVTADCTAYQLAMEITHKLIGIRDRQLEQRASAT